MLSGDPAAGYRAPEEQQGAMVGLATRVQVSKPAKLLAAAGLLFLVYILYSYRELDAEQGRGSNGEQESGAASGEELPRPPNQVRVDVYYEVLCPDSRYFVQHELLPAHAKLGDALDVRLWPYGKATTTSDGKGSWRFQCQHGPEECEGNIWHACAAVHVASQAIRLQMVECMIDDNDDAAAAASRCAVRLGVELEGMAACAGGEEGRRLHWQAGLDTDRLQPKVSFIPTIKLEGSQGSQKAILKNFLKEVCKVYEEKYHELPEGCPPT